MKKTLFLTLLFILSFSLTSQLFSQDWAPINENYKYNYKITGSEYISNTIYADSVVNESGNTVYYTNRIISHCDTCETDDYYLANQPQFLMRKVIRITPELFKFQDTTEFYIHPKAEIGESWNFTSEITAEVTQKTYETFMGINDSVKTITLSNGSEIKLTKNYGFLQFPNLYGTDNFTLVGIDNENIGEKVINYKEIFDFEVGDVFLYEVFDWASQATEKHEFYKHTIIDKYIFTDSVKYKVRRVGWYWDDEAGNSDRYLDTIFLTYCNSVNESYNKFPKELGLPRVNEYNYPEMYAPIVSHTDTSKIVSNIFPGDNDKNLIFYDQFYYPPIHPDLLTFHEWDNATYAKGYVIGLGETTHYTSSFESFYDCWITAYVKDGDTTGVISPDGYYLAVNNISENTVKIYPNPANDFIYINIKNNKQEINCKLYDLFGKLVSEQYLNNENINKINISNLKRGMYIVKLSSSGFYISRKIIKN